MANVLMKNLLIYCALIVWINSIVLLANAFDSENNHNIRLNRHGFELTQANNLQRQEVVHKVCDNLRDSREDNGLANIPDDQLDHLLIDPKHKFMYCYVPKVNLENLPIFNASNHTSVAKSMPEDAAQTIQIDCLIMNEVWWWQSIVQRLIGIQFLWFRSEPWWDSP